MSVVKNSIIPTSALNKSHNAICYHRVREAQAAGILLVGCLGIQGIIWLIQSSLTPHPQLVILRRLWFICTWVHISTSHTTRLFAESGFWDCINIFYSNRSYMVINLRGLDRYESNYTGDGKTYKQTRMYVCTGKIYESV